MENAEMIERVADAIESVDAIGYNIRLTRLVDDEATYTLTYDGETLEFPDSEEAADYMHTRRREARARAAIAAIAGE